MSDTVLPHITPEMIRRQPDQVSDILKRMQNKIETLEKRLIAAEATIKSLIS